MILSLPPQPRLHEMVSRADERAYAAAMSAWREACYTARIAASVPAVRHVDEPEPGATNVRIVAYVTLPGTAEAEATLRRKDYGPGFVEIHCDCNECCAPDGMAHFVNGVGHLCGHVVAYKHSL